jgi:RNA polymerase sigma factor (sigma-70 family)
MKSTNGPQIKEMNFGDDTRNSTMKINEVTSPLSKINKFLDDKKRKEEYARKLQKQRDEKESASVEEAHPAQQISRYNPDSETYRYGMGGGRIPNSKSISKSDITVKSKQVDFSDGGYDATQFDNVSKKEMEKNIADVLDTLTKTEQIVLKARFGMDPFDREYTLKEIGDAMGVGGERIRQIEAKAFRKLKHPSRSRKVRSYVGEDLGSVPPLPELILMAVAAKTTVDILKGSFKVAIKTGKGLKKLNDLRKRVIGAGEGVADYVMPYESINKDDYVKKIADDRKNKFYQAALDALDHLVRNDGGRSSVGSHAFEIARAFNGINAKELEKIYNANK